MVQRTNVVTYLEKGEKRMAVIYRDKNGKEVSRKNFLIEHLADENWNVTEQTLNQEKEVFKEPTVI